MNEVTEFPAAVKLPAEKYATPFPYQPMNEWVLIDRIDDATDKVGDIIIPDSAKQISNKGIIVAVGEGRVIGNEIRPIALKPGDIVLFTKHGAQETELDGNKFLLCRASEVYLKLVCGQ